MTDKLYRHSAPTLKGFPYKNNRLIGRVTVAGLITDGTIRIGVAKCAFTDVFKKSLGRVIAMGRAKSHAPFMVIEITDPDQAINQFVQAANTIITSLVGKQPERKPRPKRVKKVKINDEVGTITLGTHPEEEHAVRHHN